MPETIVFPDAAAVVGSVVRDAVAPVPVGSLVPLDRPTTFVVVRRLGGIKRNVVTDEPLLGVECWAATHEAAHDLAQLARGAVAASVGSVVAGVAIYRVEEAGGPQDLPDPLSDQPRYTFSVYVSLRGVAV